MKRTLEELVKFGDVSKEACGLRLQIVREALGLTQRKMSEIMNCKLNNYQHQERGRTYSRPEQVESLFLETGIDHNFIFRGSASGVPVGRLEALIEAATSVRARD